MSTSRLLCCGFLLVLLLVSSAVAEETEGAAVEESETATETLFDSDTKVSFAWGLDVKVNSIQDQTGTLFEIYGGALVSRSTMFAAAFGMNVGHPTVNYGYIGLLSQYTMNPKKVFHGSGQVLVARGSTKDYEREKTSLFDNYGNISGPGFWLVEPAVNAELNLSAKIRLVLGVGYRYVWGLDEDDPLISHTMVTNEDLSGWNLILGVKFATY